MHYQTRHLEAITDFPHGDRSLTTGAKFTATDVDADYLIRMKKAKAVAAPNAPAAKPAPVPASAPADAKVAQQRAPRAAQVLSPSAPAAAPKADSLIQTLADTRPTGDAAEKA